MTGDAVERLRALLDRRTTVAVLGTCDPKGRPDTCVLVAPRVGPDGTVSGGEEDGVGGRCFRNLRQNPRASLLALDPIMDPRARDGLRATLEFLGAEQDGEELGHLTAWLSAFAPGRRIARRLLFKVIEVESYRAASEGSMLQRGIS